MDHVAKFIATFKDPKHKKLLTLCRAYYEKKLCPIKKLFSWFIGIPCLHAYYLC